MNADGNKDAILSVSNVSVAFGSVRALTDVSLKVAPGERVALLGHNGAGKSTLFKSILGFTKPASGTIMISGGAPGTISARKSISYLPESIAFPKTLTGVEIMTYLARLKEAAVSEVAPLLELVGLSDAAARRTGTYSKGMRQRLGLAQALIGRPDLLLLDEPTSGLDPISRREFYNIIDRISAEGATVLISSHALTELEARTDRVAILSKGKLVAEGALAKLAREAQLPIKVRVEAKGDRVDDVYSKLGGARVNGKSLLLSCTSAGKVQLLGQIAAFGDVIDDIDIAMPSLDDVYRHYSGLAEAGGRT